MHLRVSKEMPRGTGLRVGIDPSSVAQVPHIASSVDGLPAADGLNTAREVWGRLEEVRSGAHASSSMTMGARGALPTAVLRTYVHCQPGTSGCRFG